MSLLHILFKIIPYCYVRSVSEWLGHSLAVLGVDGSSLLAASQRCDGLNSPYNGLTELHCVTNLSICDTGYSLHSLVIILK